MFSFIQIKKSLTLPSVKLLRLRNRDMIIAFFMRVFSENQIAVLEDSIHYELVDFLQENEIDDEDENEILSSDTFEQKARKYILNWTNEGFLTNYQNEQGDVYYELSSHSSKTIDWLLSLKKEEFVGTESKFNSILHQLRELVEFTNEDRQKRIELLEAKKLELEQQIQQLKAGEDIKVFEEFEIIPRFNQLNQSAKELLSDFKEVENNFKNITKGIYQKHAEGNLNKGNILDFTFTALDELKNSQQGKSFYAFWLFILNPELQSQWKELIEELFKILIEKSIPINDNFLKKMDRHLYNAAEKVSRANDKMAEKLSRVIIQKENSNSEATRKLIQEIKNDLISIANSNQKPNVSIEVETNTEIYIPFERRLTTEASESIIYTQKPQLMRNNIDAFEHLGKIFSHKHIDKSKLKKNIHNLFREKTQFTLLEVVEHHGGLQEGLPELIAYFDILKNFKYTTNSENFENIIFDQENRKLITIPEIILTK